MYEFGHLSEINSLEFFSSKVGDVGAIATVGRVFVVADDKHVVRAK